MARWVFMIGPAGGEALIPAGAAETHVARGWTVTDPPAGVDLDDPHAPAAFAEDAVTPAGHTARLVRSPSTATTHRPPTKSRKAPTEEGA